MAAGADMCFQRLVRDISCKGCLSLLFVQEPNQMSICSFYLIIWMFTDKEQLQLVGNTNKNYIVNLN